MKIVIEVSTDNSAFEDEPYTELVRILKVAIEKFEKGNMEFPLYDINGNKVGKLYIEGEKE